MTNANDKLSKILETLSAGQTAASTKAEQTSKENL